MKHRDIKTHTNVFKRPLLEINGRTLSNVHHKILIIHQKNPQVYRDNWQTTTKEGHHNSKRVFCSVPTPLGYLMNDFSNVWDESILWKNWKDFNNHVQHSSLNVYNSKVFHYLFFISHVDLNQTLVVMAKYWENNFKSPEIHHPGDFMFLLWSSSSSS